MNEQYNVSLFLIQIIIIILLFAITVWLLQLTRALRLEKRISKYTIESIHEDRPSFFDQMYEIYVKIIKRLTSFLTKIKLFDTYSLKYEKYIDGSKKVREQPMDYISLKWVSSIATVLVVILSDVLQYKSITLFQFAYSILIGFFIPDLFLISKEKYRKKQIENELLKAIIIMNNAFKSGRSTMQAIKIVSEELDGPIKEEFRKMYIDLTFGLELETVFSRFSKRVNVDEVKYITTSLTILNKTGGNIVKVFSSIERNFFNRRKLEEELHALTASASAIFKILVAIPVFLFFFIALLNKDYFTPLITNPIGIILLLIILLIYVSYIVIMKKVMKIRGL